MEQIKVVRDWLEFQLVQNISISLGFANFYYQYFSHIATRSISILKTI